MLVIYPLQTLVSVMLYTLGRAAIYLDMVVDSGTNVT